MAGCISLTRVLQQDTRTSWPSTIILVCYVCREHPESSFKGPFSGKSWLAFLLVFLSFRSVSLTPHQLISYLQQQTFENVVNRSCLLKEGSWTESSELWHDPRSAVLDHDPSSCLRGFQKRLDWGSNVHCWWNQEFRSGSKMSSRTTERTGENPAESRWENIAAGGLSFIYQSWRDTGGVICLRDEQVLEGEGCRCCLPAWGWSQPAGPNRKKDKVLSERGFFFSE